MDQKSDVRWRSYQEEKAEKSKKERINENDDGEWYSCFIKVANIHFNPPGKLAFKSNSFSYNLVLNCNLVRKLIPN